MCVTQPGCQWLIQTQSQLKINQQINTAVSLQQNQSQQLSGDEIRGAEQVRDNCSGTVQGRTHSIEGLPRVTESLSGPVTQSTFFPPKKPFSFWVWLPWPLEVCYSSKSLLFISASLSIFLGFWISAGYRLYPCPLWSVSASCADGFTWVKPLHSPQGFVLAALNASGFSCPSSCSMEYWLCRACPDPTRSLAPAKGADSTTDPQELTHFWGAGGRKQFLQCSNNKGKIL